MHDEKTRGLYGKNFTTEEMQLLKTREEIFILDICEGFWRSKQQCFATNQMIAEALGCSTKTVSRAIKNLESYGYISVVQQPGKCRVIFPANTLQSFKNLANQQNTVGTEESRGYGQESPGGMDTDVQHKTYKDKTSKNKTRSPIVPFSEKSDSALNFELEHYRLLMKDLQFPKSWDQAKAKKAIMTWFEYRVRENKTKYFSPLTVQKLINRFQNNRVETFCECCEQSEANNWSSLQAPRDVRTRSERLKEKWAQQEAEERAKDPVRYDAAKRLREGTATLEDHRICGEMPAPGCWVDEKGEIQYYVPEDFKLTEGEQNHENV